VSLESYIEVLKEGLLPLYTFGDLFMQDNALVYKSYRTMKWLSDEGVELIEWPPHSPDLNPIEHVWWELKKQIYKMEP
jgi:transposase